MPEVNSVSCAGTTKSGCACASAETGTKPGSVATSLPLKRFMRSSLYDGTSRSISSSTASGSNGLSFGSSPLRSQPHGVPIGLARLRAARLSQVGGHTRLAERNQLSSHPHADRGRQANQDFEIRLHTCLVSCLAHQLHIAVGVGHRARLLIKTGRRQHHIGKLPLSPSGTYPARSQTFSSATPDPLRSFSTGSAPTTSRAPSLPLRAASIISGCVSPGVPGIPAYSSANAPGSPTGTYPGSRSGSSPMSAAPRELA